MGGLNGRISAEIRSRALKGQAAISGIMIALSFLLSPIAAVFVLVYKGAGLLKIKNMSRVAEFRRGSIFEEVLWVLVATAAGSFLPLGLGIVLIGWRTIMLILAVKRGVRNG